ncbi:class I SAM-dependent methyltransferase [Catenulispora yoronensis]
MTVPTAMEDLEVASLLYREPGFYAEMTDAAAPKIAASIAAVVRLYGPIDAVSVLDVGCGTGAILEQLAKTYSHAVGVDLLPGMVEVASEKRAHLDVRCGDMRTARLGEVFEVVVCVGNALSYMIRDQDVTAAFATFAKHCVPAGLLLIQTLTDFPKIGVTKESVALVAGRTAKATVNYRVDPDGALVTNRTWDFGDGQVEQDRIRRRVLPMTELSNFAAAAGFRPADWPEPMPGGVAAFVKHTGA